MLNAKQDISNEQFISNLGHYGTSARIHAENLVLIHDLLQGIIPWAYFGTLLGLVRGGYPIEGDGDQDLVISNDDRLKLELAATHAHERGFQIARNSPDILTFLRKNQYVDVYLYRQVPGGDYEIARYYRTPKAFLEDPEILMFDSRKFLRPRDTDAVLTHLYGDDWRTPRRNCHARP